ncbi:MAG: DUF2892 domain-containing protein [Haloferacaceae archaeon]
MEKNVGRTDRIVRFVVGGVLAIVGLAALGGLFTIAAGTTGLVVALVALVVGLVLVWTGYTQRCLLYGPFGISTYEGAAAEGDEETKAGPSA